MKYYLVMGVQPWNNIQGLSPTGHVINLDIQMDDGCVGYLPIYTSREEAKKAFPRLEVMEIEGAQDDDDPRRPAETVQREDSPGGAPSQDDKPNPN